MKKEKKTAAVKTSVYGITLVGLLVGLVVTILAAVTFGNADISIKEVYSVIMYELFKTGLSCAVRDSLGSCGAKSCKQ